MVPEQNLTTEGPMPFSRNQKKRKLIISLLLKVLKDFCFIRSLEIERQ